MRMFRYLSHSHSVLMVTDVFCRLDDFIFMYYVDGLTLFGLSLVLFFERGRLFYDLGLSLSVAAATTPGETA